MIYVSTRGRAPPLAFSEVLTRGLAADGGLYVPQQYPRVTKDELQSWRALSYADLAAAVIGKFVDDIAPDDLLRMCRATYTGHTFGHGRPDSDVTKIAPLRWLEPGFGLLELSNGPTLAFKDMALQLLGALFEHVLGARNARLNIVGATSGDTGSAAEYALRGRERVQVFMLSPYGRMSAFQRAQMYSLNDANIHNLAIDGVFDDCQDLVKAIAGAADFRERHAVGTVNSINWGRIAAQVVYYVAGWLAATDSADQRVSFAVPSGNFGNIFSGWVAKKIGVPIERLVLATNENDVLHEFFMTGRYRIRAPAETHVTSSPSMDISKASNFERFVFDLIDRDDELLRELYWQVDTRSEFHFGGTPIASRVGASGIVSGRSTHTDRLRTIRNVHERHGILIDPHTADGLKVAFEQRDPAVPMICLETAQPAKFGEIIVEAIGMAPPRPRGYEDLEQRPQRFERMAADVQELKQYIARHAI